MSPKNKGKFGKGKPAIETEDEFISTMGRVGQALEPHAKKIVLGAAAITLLLAAYFGYQWWNDRKETAATALYTKAVVLSTVGVLPSFDEAPPAAGTDGATDAAEQPAAAFVPEDLNDDLIPDSYPTRAERAKAVLAILEQLKSDYGATEVAKSANLLYGTMLYDLGKYQDALDAFESFVSHTSSDRMELAGREGMGAASEAMALAIADPAQRSAALDRTLEIYRGIQDEQNAPGWDHVLYHTARIQIAQGKRDEARKTLEKALADIETMNADTNTPTSIMESDVKQRLAQLQSN